MECLNDAGEMLLTQTTLSRQTTDQDEVWDEVFADKSKDLCRKTFPAPDPNKLSSKALSFNIVLSIVGTTVLGISAQMRVGGWILPPLLLCLGCAIVSELTLLVSDTIDELQMKGHNVVAYQDYVEGSLGRHAKAVSTVSSALALLGMICNGFILEANNLQFFAPLKWQWFWESEHGGRNWWALLLSSTTILYCFVDAASLLKKSAALGPFVCAACVVLAWLGTGSAVKELEYFPESCQNAGDQLYWSFLPGDGSGDIWTLVSSITNISAYSFYCFAVVITVPSLKHEMQEPRQLAPAAISAYIVCVALFLSIMLVGYWGFGNLTPDNLIDGMRQDRPAGWWATTRPWETGSGTLAGNTFAWMIIVNLLLTDAIYVPCTVINLENSAPDFFNGRCFRGFCLRIFVVVFRLIVATYVDSFIALTNLTSSLFCVVTNVLFPVLAFHSIRERPVSKLRKASHLLIFCFGCVVMLFGTGSAVMDIISPPDALTQSRGFFPRQAISGECQRLYEFALEAKSTAG